MTTLALFVVVFNSDDGVGYKITVFEGFADALSERFNDFGPFGLCQDAAVKPLLSGFL